jgi:uncharacterized membrane protein YcjF (UPF0283 family)
MLQRASARDVLEFRHALERRWGIEAKLNELYDATAELGNAVRDRSDLRTNQIINALTIFGFPVVFLASFFQFIIDRNEGIHWLGLGSYIVLSVLGVVLVRAVIEIMLRREQRRLMTSGPSSSTSLGISGSAKPVENARSMDV